MSRPARFITRWGLISLVAGIACSFIPWGDDALQIHRYGLPVPLHLRMVSPASGEVTCNTNPLALVANPVLIFILGLGVWGVVLAIRRVWRRKGLEPARSTDADEPRR